MGSNLGYPREAGGRSGGCGMYVGANDLLFAAHARRLGLALITNNIEEFSRVAGLKLANWAA